MDLIFILEWCALLTTLYLHFVPFEAVTQMVKKKSTKEVPFLTYVITSLCCIQFAVLSYVSGHLPFLLLNLLGFVLNTSYFIAYCHVSEQKTTCWVYVLVATNYVIMLFYHLIGNYPQPEEFVHRLTFYSAFLVTLFSILPLPEVIGAFWRKQATPMSHRLQLLILFNSACMVLYGHVLDSLSVSLPNLIGLLVQVAKSVAIIVFAKSRKEEKDKKKIQ